MWIGTRQQLATVIASELTLTSAIVRFSTTVSDLCFIVDSQLNMLDHVVVWRFHIWLSLVDRFQLFRAVGTTSILHISRTKTTIGSRSFAVVGPCSHMVQFTRWAENTQTVCSVFYQAFEDLSLQQLLTATCSTFVVRYPTSFLICAVHKCPYYYYYYYYYYVQKINRY